MSQQQEPTADFGFQQVPVTEKVNRVRQVFDSVAGNYDLMNDLMSMGVHRLWKRFLVGTSGVRPGQRVLDLAGGTGDITRLLLDRVGTRGEVILSDINLAMMREGRGRLLDEGQVERLRFVQANAEKLPVQDSSLDCITMAFGLRNVTDKQAALNSMYQALRPGGQALILEFSQVQLKALRPFYDVYSFQVLPRLGSAVAGDRDSYQYLVESIRKHPPQVQLREMMEQAGFERCDVRNLTGGIVAIHRGYKL